MLYYLSLLIFIYGARSHEGHCPQFVSSILLKEDFDFSQFMGKWYVLSWYADNATTYSSWKEDFAFNFVQTNQKEATLYSQARDPLASGDCDTEVSTLNDTETSGKLILTTGTETSPFWVLETDYVQFAFAYGCLNVTDAGECANTRAWILSRTKSLSSNFLYQSYYFYHALCIDEDRIETVLLNQDCSINTHQRVSPEQNCNVEDILDLEEIDLEKYAGRWYETSWLSPFYIPEDQLFHDYQHHYIITGDGNITAYIYGRAAQEPDKCFHRTATLKPEKAPGRFTYSDHIGKYPYWVLSTDYTQYAVVYGCNNVSSDGSCYEARSWIWSRTPTLPDKIQYKVNRILQSVCVNPSAYLPTRNSNECPPKLTWNVDDNINCNVSSFKVKEKFNFDKFTGVWCEVATLNGTEGVSNRQVNLLTRNLDDLTSQVRSRRGDMCTYESAVWFKDGSVGKYNVNKSSEDSRPVWVAGTDYSSYAVLYTCERVGSDGQCETARGSVWSRSPTLPPQHQYTANSLLQELCLNPAALVTMTQNDECPPQQENVTPKGNGASRKTQDILIVTCFHLALSLLLKSSI